MRRKASPSHDSVPASNTSWIDIFKLAIEAIRVLAWPMVFCVVLVTFYSPLQQLAHSFPQKFADANKVSIGNLSLEIAAKAKEVGDPVFVLQIGSLTADAVEVLLQTPKTGFRRILSNLTHDLRSDKTGRAYGRPPATTMAALQELSEKGFIQLKHPLETLFAQLNRLPKSKELSDDASHDGWYVAYPADSEDDKTMRDHSYELTDKGRLAVDAIIKAVSAQISSSRSNIPL